MTNPFLKKTVENPYKYGFETLIESDSVPPGLNEDIIRFISKKKNEPAFLLDFRLKAYAFWKTMTPPNWAHLHHEPIDYQGIIYYSAPKSVKDGPKSLADVDPKLLETYSKLGIPLHEQGRLAGIAVDAVFDSVSVATTFKGKLKEVGVIFCSFSEAVQTHPELIEQYLGTVVPYRDNFFATLNSAVFTDGSFVYIPKGVRCPMELSTYFRINAANTGQFERTLIIADDDSYVSYLEGCTAPMRDENQLHAAVVELIALERAQIKYSTVQNWYPGDENGKGGIYNFVTKRGHCRGSHSKISWTQIETGSAITWKYPSVILKGDYSIGEFYSVALTNHYQQADTGTKMIHIGKNTTSTIISKGITAGFGQNSYRGLVRMLPTAHNARNYTQCDSLLLSDTSGAHTFPYIEVKNATAQVEHEASTSKIGEDQLFYCRQRGLKTEDAISLIVNGFCKQVFNELPMEFAVEAQKLLEVSLEGSVGVINMLKINELNVSILDEKQGVKSILRGLSLEIKAGEVHAIMGPNGSGKSTLSNVLAGREDYQVESGSVEFNEHDLLSMSPEARAQAGIFLSFQYPVEIPGVNNMYFLRSALNSIRQSKGLPLIDAADFLKIVKTKIKEVGLDDALLHRSVNESFSGGEKKRNEILQMLVLEPQFIILDEMDSGLDVDALQRLSQCVNSMRSDDRGILMVTHYDRLLQHIVPDYVHVMVDGRIIKSGDKTLAHKIEQQGYAWLLNEAAS